MGYENKIKEAFYNTGKNLLPAKLHELMPEDTIEKKLFLKTCLNILPTSSCTDFLIYSYAIFSDYTKNDWLSLTRDLNLAGKYTLATFLHSYTSFNKESLDEIGLDRSSAADNGKDDKLNNQGIKTISFKDSSFMLQACKSLGLSDSDIEELRKIRLR